MRKWLEADVLFARSAPESPAVVLGLQREEETVARISSEHGIHTSVLRQWKATRYSAPAASTSPPSIRRRVSWTRR